MSPVSLAFFTIDYGTASTAVALVAPLDGRFRLLASGVAPRGTDLDALLEDLVLRVDAVEPGLLVASTGWRDWARLESATHPAHRVLCLGPTDDAAADVQRAFEGAGWEMAGRVSADHLEPLSAMEACLDPRLSALAIGDVTSDADRAAWAGMLPMLAAVMHQRPGLPVLLCGQGIDRSGLASEALIGLPAAGHVGVPGDSPLRQALSRLDLPRAPGRQDASEPMPARVRDRADGRQTVRQSVSVLATLLDRRIEAVDIGHSGGMRTLAYPTGSIGHLISADAALVPADALDDPQQVDEIARWSAIRSDPFSLADRLRNLRLSPWRDVAGDGARLRLAALRAALARLDRQWRDPAGQHPAPGADMLICAGGAFAAVPPPAAAMAVVDGMRRPGAVTLFHDHARLLGPIGALPDVGDQRRLLADLLDDALLPLGSAIVTGEVRAGARVAATLKVTSHLQQHDLDLAPNALRLVDLPPGVPAQVEVEMREGQVLGVRARRIALDVTGGLGGLLIDTREVPLRLPERAERRRALLEAWERPVWGIRPMTVARRPHSGVPVGDARLVAPSEPLARAPLARLRLRLGDRSLVSVGEPVFVGQPVMSQARETVLLEVPLRGDLDDLLPGAELDVSQLQPARGVGRHSPRPGDRAYLLYVGVDRIARVVLARAPMTVASPIEGIAEEVTASQISLRSSGVGLRGPVGWGQPVVGRVILAVSSPDAELRSGAVDISAAGSVLVAGARLDIEALTRARAIGVAGIICGGVVGRELQQLDESDVRQRAALHAIPPFAILALDGFGRRPIPTLAWDLLAAAAADERQVGILPDARLAVVGGDPTTLELATWPPDAVRVAAGDGAGRAGRLVGLAGPVRRPGGAYQSSGYVAFGATSDGPATRRVVPLADLERLG